MRSVGRSYSILLLGFGLLFGGSGARCQNQSALVERMAKAEAETSLYAVGMAPWHLKASFQIEASAGRAADSGTIEEWWAGPIGRKVVFTSRSFSATDIRNKDGYFRTTGSAEVPYLVKVMEREIVQPLPDRALSESSDPHLTRKKLGDIQLECISLMKPEVRRAESSPFLYPTYCFRNTSQLVVSYDLGLQAITHTQWGTFRGRNVSIQTSLGFAGQTAISAHVDLLQGAALTEKDFEAGPEMTKLSALVDFGSVFSVDPNAGEGEFVSKTKPVYPALAKTAHMSGPVLIYAVVGTDGHVLSTEVLYSPYPVLGEAAVEAVRQWVWKRYLVNGEPVPRDATVQVNFHIGG